MKNDNLKINVDIVYTVTGDMDISLNQHVTLGTPLQWPTCIDVTEAMLPAAGSNDGLS